MDQICTQWNREPNVNHASSLNCKTNRVVSLVWREQVALDTGNNKMLVSASDGVRSVGGTLDENHAERLDTLVNFIHFSGGNTVAWPNRQ